MFHNEDEHGYDRLGVSANYLKKEDLQELRKCIGAFLQNGQERRKPDEKESNTGVQ